jgi:pimeloyl-ACP methyl ester carboxylesterase
MTAGIIVGAFIAALALIAAAIWLLGSRAKERLVVQYPPPGQMVEVGGFRMHIDCQGDPAAGPAVIMDSGQAEPGLAWASVQPAVAEFARACVFDRAGLGWSEPSPNPRTLANYVKEQHALLAGADVEPPYVLVGHSAGGLYARVYARDYPDEVAGMVLVDAGHEDLDVRPPESMTKFNKRIMNLMARTALPFFQMLSSAGIFALIPDKGGGVWPNPIPEGVREAYAGVAASGRRWFATMGKETTAMWGNLAAAREMELNSLGDMPLVVLSRGLTQMSTGPGVSAEDVEGFRIANDQMQAELAALSTRGKQIIAEDCGHHIHVEQPQLVIDAIREVVEAARAES